MADHKSDDEVFDFSKIEFTREDLVNELNDMVKEYRKLSDTFDEVKSENDDLKNSSAEPSVVELGEADSLKIELSKLTAENDLLRSKSSELESENERLNMIISSWTKSSVYLGKLHDAQKLVNDKSGLGFNSSESSEGETSTQSQLVYEKFNKMSFVKASVTYDSCESMTYNDQTSQRLNHKGKAGIGYQRPENSKTMWLKNKLDKDKAIAGSKSFAPNQPRRNLTKVKSSWRKVQPNRDLSGQNMKSTLNRSHHNYAQTLTDSSTGKTIKERGNAIQISLLLENIPNLVLGESLEFPSSKILTEKTVHRYISLNDKVGVENVADVPRVKKTPVKKAVSKKRPAVTTAAEPVVASETTVGEPAVEVAEEIVVEGIAELVSEPAVADVSNAGISTADDVDIIIGQVLADIAQIGPDEEEQDVGGLDVAGTAVSESGVGKHAAPRFDELEKWFTLSYEEFHSRDADQPVVTANDTDEDMETVEFGKGFEEQQLQIFYAAVSRTDATADYTVIDTVEEMEMAAVEQYANEAMSLEEILMTIPVECPLTSGSGEITKITLGKSISIPGVHEGDWYKASLPKIPATDKGKAILMERDPIKGNPVKEQLSLILADIEVLVQLQEQIIDDVDRFFNSFSLKTLAALQTEDISAKEELVLSWAEKESTRVALHRKTYVQLQEQIIDDVDRFFNSFSLKTLAALQTEDISAKEELVLSWAEKESTRVALHRKTYILTKYKELLIRKFLDAHRENFVPGDGSSAVNLKILDKLSSLHLFLVEELKMEVQAHSLKWDRTCCSQIFERRPRDRGAAIAITNTNTRSTCWIRTMICVDGVWVIEPCGDHWVKIPRWIVNNEILRQRSYDDTLHPISKFFQLMKKRWGDVCIEAIEFSVSGKLLPVGSITFCRALSVVEPVSNFGYHRQTVVTLGWSQLCTAFVQYSLFSGLSTNDIRSFVSTIALDRSVLRDVHSDDSSMHFVEDDIQMEDDSAPDRYNLEATRKEVKDLKAALSKHFDDKLADIRKKLLEFRVETRGQLASLGTHLAELIAFLTKGSDDKKGEDSSSLRPQPPSDDQSRPSGGSGGGGNRVDEQSRPVGSGTRESGSRGESQRRGDNSGSSRR
ncbi:hypothetical protein F511_14624 [Dorcoceras hygrometricum]|uniref:Uncharacterized protein n=1 Tax=Dorcoceras hygrometricum TaxID=472368 RepID=A0A2Z6ZY33_9LAMI|nr:hypothetical protein F511_14624 [Dorcoceras hygrometricum]